MSMSSRTKIRLVVGLVPILALGLVLHGFSAWGSPAKPTKELPADQTDANDLLAGSAIAAVIEGNDGKVPASGEQLYQVLRQFGEVDQLVIPFSAISLDSGLSNPRVILTPHTASIGQADVDRPNLGGRLFLALNLEKVVNADPQVTSVEFISWNSRRRQFDFGVIESLGSAPQIKVVDGIRCFSCHKNRGPILGAKPWSNTTHNDIIRRATELALFPAPQARVGGRDRIDGIAMLFSQAPEVDAAVRQGASLYRDRDTFRLLSRDPDGRKAFSILLCGIASPGGIEKVDQDIKGNVNKAFSRSFSKFSSGWLNLQKTSKSSILNDFSPAGSVGTPRGWSGSTSIVMKYDISRLSGNHGLTSAAQPSNPKAFIKPQAYAPGQPSSVVSASLLARTIGLTTGDRKFLSDTLSHSVKRVGKGEVTPATLAREVFEGGSFEDLLNEGELPDREDFKDRFVAGLDSALRNAHGLQDGFVISRSEYASGPRIPPGEGLLKEPKLVPTTACLACHSVRAEGKARFVEPLPALAFDPFDKAARQTWLRNAEKKRRVDVLGRMLKRLAEDKDMPPTDSAEHEIFRMNNAASFEEAKKFLETSLKHAKAN